MWKAVVFKRIESLQMGAGEGLNDFAARTGATPEYAMQMASEEIWNKISPGTVVGRTTWQPASGVVFVEGEPSGYVHEIA